MRISHLHFITKPVSIVVRNYDNDKIVHVPTIVKNGLHYKTEHELGEWKIKYKNFVAKEYLKDLEIYKKEN